MLTSGVAKLKAKVMYFAVLRFDPPWKVRELTIEPCPQKPVGRAAYNCEPVLADDARTKVVYELEEPKYDEAEMKEDGLFD